MFKINNNACRFDLLLQRRVKDLLEALIMILRQLRAEVQKSDAGALYIKNCGGRITFTEYKDKKELLEEWGRNARRLSVEVYDKAKLSAQVAEVLEKTFINLMK